MKYLIILILFLMVIFLKNASISLLIYSFFAADRDGYGFLEFFSTMYPDFKLFSRSIFLILTFYTFWFLFFKVKRLNKKETYKIFSVILVSFLIVFNSLIKGDGFIWAISLLVFNGVPAYFIWYIMGLKNNNNNIFLQYISLKVIVATIVLLVPSLIFLDGSLYKSAEGLFVNDVSDLNLSVPTGESIKGAYSRYSIYHNPNSLGFHSVISILIGTYFILYSRKYIKFLGLILIFCGLVGWLNSLTRGPMVLLIIGFIYIIVLNVFYGKRKNFEMKFLLLLSIVGGVFFILLSSSFSEYLIPNSADTSVVGRMQGYVYSIDIIKNHLMLGVGKGWDWGNYYPHFIPLSLTVDHGIVVGVIESLLIFLGGLMSIITASKSYLRDPQNRGTYFLSIMLVFIVFGIAVTNNFTSPIIFWIMLAQADILNKGLKYD